MKKIALLLLGLLLAGSAFAAPEVTFRVLNGAEPPSLDPALSEDNASHNVLMALFEGLLIYDPKTNDGIPGMAESYTVNAAGDEFTFKLRKGVKFTDGSPFNAQAVKWTIDRVMKLQGQPSWLVTDYVDSVSAVDDYTVKFKLKFPCAYFHTVVATPPYYPVSPNIYPADKIIWDPSEMKGGELVGLGA